MQNLNIYTWIIPDICQKKKKLFTNFTNLDVYSDLIIVMSYTDGNSFYSSLVYIRLKHNMEAHFMESTGMDVFFFFFSSQEFCFIFCSWLKWIQILPFQTCAAHQSKASRFQLKNVGVWSFIVILDLLLHLTSRHLCKCVWCLWECQTCSRVSWFLHLMYVLPRTSVRTRVFMLV